MQCACVILYCRLSPVRLYHVLPHYLIQGTIFGKNVLVMKIVLLLSGQLFSETLLILRRNERNIVINVHRPLFWSDFNET